MITLGSHSLDRLFGDRVRSTGITWRLWKKASRRPKARGQLNVQLLYCYRFRPELGSNHFFYWAIDQRRYAFQTEHFEKTKRAPLRRFLPFDFMVAVEFLYKKNNGYHLILIGRDFGSKWIPYFTEYPQKLFVSFVGLYVARICPTLTCLKWFRKENSPIGRKKHLFR